MTNSAKTRLLPLRLAHKFKIAQRAMERAMSGFPLVDKIRKKDIRKRNKVTT